MFLKGNGKLFLFLDIETSGLSSKLDFISCVGVLSRFGVRVFSGSEEQLLSDFFEFFSNLVNEFGLSNLVLVSFNGLFFDVPFILEKAKKFSIDLSDLNRIRHVDLMPLVSEKYEDLVAPLKTGRLSKDGVRSWFNIYEPKAPNALNCVLTVKTSSDWGNVFLHNSLDLFTTKKIFDKCVELGWVLV